MKLMDYENHDGQPLDVKSWDRLFGDTATNSTWSREIPTFTDARLLKAIYFTEDWVYILVDKIAMMLAPIPLKVYKETTMDGQITLEPALNHPVQYILDNPNKHQTNYDLQYTSITDYCVTGNILLYNAIINRTLIHIPSEIINMDIDANGMLRSYSVIGYDRQSMPLNQLKSRIDPSNIIHIKRPNPSSIHWGMSPLVPGQSPVLFNRYSSEYLNNFYRKGAQPGMVITTPDGVTQRQREDLQNSLEKQNMGRQNQRRFLVLPNGSKGEAFAHTIADQQLLEHIRNNRETVINLFGVPKEVLSIQESGTGLGSDQYKSAIKNFWGGTLMSIGNMFADALTKAYKPYLGENYKIKKDYSGVPELQENLREKSDLATAMLSTMTLNEVRKQVWKLDPIAGGDLPPPNARPQQTFGGFGGGFPQQSSAEFNSTGKPVPIERVEEVPKEEEKTQELDYKSENLVNFGRFTREEGKSWWTEREDRTAQESAKREEPIRELFLDLILDQVATASAIAKDSLVQKAVDMPDEAELKRRIKKTFEKQRKEWTENYTKILNDQVELGYDSVLSMPFGKPDQDAIQASRDENFKARRKELIGRSNIVYDYLADTTVDKIINTIKAGIVENLGLKEIGNAIKNIAKISLGRADTIARTEVLTALSLGQAAAMKDASKVIPDLYKVWVNAGDERVRGNPGGIYPDSKGDHWNIAGEAIPYNKAFGNGLQYPREGGGPPHEVINCFPADTDVSAFGINKVFQRIYRGPMVTLNMESGAKISATPNHPMLTTKGWIAIGKLTKGDKLIKASGFKKSVLSDHDVKEIKSSISKVFASFSESCMSVSRNGTGSNFHGDGAIGNVNIVNTMGNLKSSFEPVGIHKSTNFGFENSNLAHSLSPSLSTEYEPVGGVRLPHSSISASNLLSSFVDSLSGPFEQLSIPSAPLLNSSLFEPSTDSYSGDIQFPADFEYRQVLDEVHIDNITNVDVRSFHGHVYNLETVSEWYLANDYITHNCRCTLLAVSEKDLKRLGIRKA